MDAEQVAKLAALIDTQFIAELQTEEYAERVERAAKLAAEISVKLAELAEYAKLAAELAAIK